jgi:ribonuclease III
VSDLDDLQARLGYVFQDAALLRLALTHPSLAHEQGANLQHNQRLEFLGDAVLQLVLTADLYARFPDVAEGALTKARAHLVNRSALAVQGRRLNLGEHLLVSRGEQATGGRERSSALADAYEALLGALFLDGGFEVARGFIRDHFREAFGELGVIPNLENPKGELQELLQSRSNDAPQYRLEAISGPDHDRQFVCSVHHQGNELARGTGRSKKEAESQAAREALRLAAGTPGVTGGAGAESSEH